MHSAIVSKLQSLLTKGIGSEAEAVYLLVETRKLLEQQNAKEQYRYLTFHCDWAVHSELRGTTAQNVLMLFDEAAAHLRNGAHLSDLSVALRNEIEAISKMAVFEKQLDEFLRGNQLPSLEFARNDGWSHFLHLYSQIVEDCPLVMRMSECVAIESVAIKLEVAAEPVCGDTLFKVRWLITDKTGDTGELFIVHSFEGELDSTPAPSTD